MRLWRRMTGTKRRRRRTMWLVFFVIAGVVLYVNRGSIWKESSIPIQVTTRPAGASPTASLEAQATGVATATEIMPRKEIHYWGWAKGNVNIRANPDFKIGEIIFTLSDLEYVEIISYKPGFWYEVIKSPGHPTDPSYRGFVAWGLLDTGGVPLP